MPLNAFADSVDHSKNIKLYLLSQAIQTGCSFKDNIDTDGVGDAAYNFTSRQILKDAGKNVYVSEYQEIGGSDDEMDCFEALDTLLGLYSKSLTEFMKGAYTPTYTNTSAEKEITCSFSETTTVSFIFAPEPATRNYDRHAYLSGNDWYVSETDAWDNSKKNQIKVDEVDKNSTADTVCKTAYLKIGILGNLGGCHYNSGNGTQTCTAAGYGSGGSTIVTKLLSAKTTSSTSGGSNVIDKLTWKQWPATFNATISDADAYLFYEDMVFNQCKAKKGVKESGTTLNNQKDAKYIDSATRKVVKDGIAYDISWSTKKKTLKETGHYFSFTDGKATCEQLLNKMNEYAPKYETYLKNNPDETAETSIPEATAPPEATKEEPTCESNGGSMAWIMCPIVTAMSAGVNWLMGMINSQLNYQSINASDTIKLAWDKFIPIANIAFAIVFLMIIYSTAIGGKFG